MMYAGFFEVFCVFFRVGFPRFSDPLPSDHLASFLQSHLLWYLHYVVASGN